MCIVCSVIEGVVTVSVLLSSGQCINRVMRLVVWGGVERYERCMTSWCMREHCMFLTVEILPLFSVSRVLWNRCAKGEIQTTCIS